MPCLPLLALGADTVRFFRDGLVVLILVEALIGNVIICGCVLHGAIDGSVTIAFLFSTFVKLAHLVLLLFFVALVLRRLVLLDVFHEAAELGARVGLENVHAEDLGDVALRCQDDLVEHDLTALINNVTIFIN